MLFVTGITGFIGKHLIKRLLSDGHKITCFVKDDDVAGISFLEDFDVEVIKGDIRDEKSVKATFDKCKGIQAVIHLAAIIKPGPGGDKEFIDVNVNGTTYLVQECERRGIKRFVFYSTDFVIYDYHNIYGDSKADAEKVLKASKLDYTILRPTPVYGPGDDKNFDTLFNLVRKFPIVPSVSCIMQPVHVKDVVEATVAVLNNKKTYRKEYNLAGGSAVSFSQIVKLLAKEMGHTRLIIRVPNLLMRTAVRTYERIAPHPIVRDYQISKWMINKELSIEENRKDFGYTPITFEQGMSDTMRAIGISKNKSGNSD